MKINVKLIPRPLLSVALVLCPVTFAWAQTANKDDYPRVEVFIGYSALGETAKDIKLGPGSSIGRGYAATAGFETSVVRNFTRNIGLKGDFSAHFKNDTSPGVVTICAPACSTASQSVQLKTGVYNFLAGPEFKARNSTRFTPFAHVLAGLAHTSANFKTPGPTFTFAQERSNNGFAMALGGGLDIRATKRFGFRGQMDYNPVFLHDSTGGRRDLVRISLGVLFH